MMFDQGSPMPYYTFRSDYYAYIQQQPNLRRPGFQHQFYCAVPNKSATFNWTSYVDRSMSTADFSQIHTYLQYQGLQNPGLRGKLDKPEHIDPCRPILI